MSQESVLNIVVKAVDEASGTVGKINSSLKSMEPQFKAMAVAGTAAFGTIAAIGVKAIKDYADAEKSAAMLEHAVIGVTHATKEQLQATSDLADALEKKGVLDGDNIKQGLAQLSTFGLSNNAVRALGGSLADLAVNQFGVSASGEQLSDTANMIAKALNGQFGVLEKSGIRFTEAQKHVIQFGTEMEKVKAINEGFAQNLKFTNETALTTTEGQLAKASVQAGNLSEALGKTLTPIVNALAEAIVPLLNRIQSWIEAHPELTKKIVIAAAAVAAIVAVVGTLGLIIPTVVAGFSAVIAIAPLVGGAITLMMGPIGLIIVAIGLLVAAGVAVYKNWDTIKQKASEVWTAIKDFVKENWDKILLVLTGGLGGIVVLFIQNFGPISEAWNTIWNAVKDAFFGIVDAIKGAVLSMINFVIEKANAAIALANSAISLANKLPGVNISNIPSIQKRATGGPVDLGMPYIVGENGPEMFMPRASGTILNADETRSLRAPSAQSVNIKIMEGANVTITNEADEMRLVQRISSELSKALQNQRLGLTTAI